MAQLYNFFYSFNNFYLHNFWQKLFILFSKLKVVVFNGKYNILLFNFFKMCANINITYLIEYINFKYCP